MKTNRKIAYLLLMACLTACASISSIQPLSDNYQIITYTQNSISEPSAHQITLQYQKSDDSRIMIWPSLDSGVIVNNKVAIFDAVMGSHESKLFAVKAPELPLNITSEVLWRWSKQSGGDFEKLLRKASVVYEKEKQNAVEFHFVDGSHKDIVFSLEWKQIVEIMREVKEKGVVCKDPVWGTSYIEKEFKPETQK